MAQLINTLSGKELDARLQHTTEPIVLDFYQASCAPCRMLEPRLERIATRYNGRVAVFRIDIDRDVSVAERFGVMSIPTLLVFRNGQEVERLDGLIREPELAALFQRLAPGTTTSSLV